MQQAPIRPAVRISGDEPRKRPFGSPTRAPRPRWSSKALSQMLHRTIDQIAEPAFAAVNGAPSDDFQEVSRKCELTPAGDSSTVKSERHVNRTTQIHVP